MEDWRVSIISSHRGALNRQVTEAVSISKEGVENLLNSKSEFGANNITEITVKKGNAVMGVMKRKRKDEEEEEAPRQQPQQLQHHQQQQVQQQHGQQQRKLKIVMKSTVKRNLPKEEPWEGGRMQMELCQENGGKEWLEQDV